MGMGGWGGGYGGNWGHTVAPPPQPVVDTVPDNDPHVPLQTTDNDPRSSYAAKINRDSQYYYYHPAAADRNYGYGMY